MRFFTNIEDMRFYRLFVLFCLTKQEESDCLLCQILDENPLKLAPSQGKVENSFYFQVLLLSFNPKSTNRSTTPAPCTGQSPTN